MKNSMSDFFGGLIASAIVGSVAWAINSKFKQSSKGGAQPPNFTKVSRPAPQQGRGGADLGRVFKAVLGVVDQIENGQSHRPTAAAPAPRGPQPQGTAIGHQLVRDLQRDFGLTRAQAAGVVGNIHHECGGFTLMQEARPLIKGSRGGYGYCQWTGPRRRSFEAWAAARGLALNSYAANYGYLKHELTNTSERRVMPHLRRAQTVRDATLVFQNKFLRPGIPHTSRRLAAAQRYA